jgi:hypothetical protein
MIICVVLDCDRYCLVYVTLCFCVSLTWSEANLDRILWAWTYNNGHEPIAIGVDTLPGGTDNFPPHADYFLRKLIYSLYALI